MRVSKGVVTEIEARGIVKSFPQTVTFDLAMEE